MTSAFGRAALGRLVVERVAEHRAAESLPVRPGVGEVQVPRRVHVFGRAHGRSTGHREEHVPLVLFDDAIGVGAGPAVLAGEPRREREGGGAAVDVEGQDAGQQVGTVRSHGQTLRGTMRYSHCTSLRVRKCSMKMERR